MIVADTNLISYLFLTGPHSERAEQALAKDSSWIAPVLWRSEFQNVLALYLRKNLIALEDAISIMDEAIELMADGEYKVSSHKVLRLAQQSECSAYDCEFVALAQEIGVSLVTSDKKLLRKFPKNCVSLQDY